MSGIYFGVHVIPSMLFFFKQLWQQTISPGLLWLFCEAEILVNSSLSGVMAAGSVVLLIYLIWGINIKQTCLIDSRPEEEEETDIH